VFKLRIETNNAAFMDGNEYAEIIRILNDVILKLDRGNPQFNLFDLNGNKVGEYKLTNR
jgi:hypothetical protein